MEVIHAHRAGGDVWMTSGEGIGARARRKEDARHLAGHGQFVGDIRIAGMQDVAFLRSPVAHARITGRRKPVGKERDVFFLSDFVGVKPIVTKSSIPGYKVIVNAHPSVVDLLQTEERDTLKEAERRYQRQIMLVPHREYHIEQFDLAGS